MNEAEQRTGFGLRLTSRHHAAPRLPGRRPAPWASPPDDRERGAGFTLIELLVVIAVVALLMGILLPTLHRVRRQARAVACRANLRQWTIILKAYTTETEGALHNQGYCEMAAPEFWMHWLSRTAQGTEKIRCCPMATRPASPIPRFQADRQIGFVSHTRPSPLATWTSLRISRFGFRISGLRPARRAKSEWIGFV